MKTRTTVADVQFLLMRPCKCSCICQTIIPVVCIASRTAVDMLVLRAFIVHDPIFALRALSQLSCLARPRWAHLFMIGALLFCSPRLLAILAGDEVIHWCPWTFMHL